MPVISITRLRVRSSRFLLSFIITAFRIGKYSRFTTAGPAHLVQGKQSLQLVLQIFDPLTADNLHGKTRVQTLWITREQRTKRRFQCA